MLVLKDLVKDYEAGAGTVRALRGLSLRFRKNEFVSILGPSGCGKTTLLNIIGGLDQYTSGDLLIRGRSTRNFRDRDWDAYRNHSIGFVFQSYNLIPHQSVLRNVELALTLSGVPREERRQRAVRALEQVGLGDQLKKRPAQMSGGQMQRVAIARALVNDPEIILADEPTGALDSETSVQVMELLRQVARDRLVIMVTHNPELARRYSTRIVRMLDGRVISDSDPVPDDAPAPVFEEQPARTGRRKKPSMSLLTAFGLSLNNLFTKKGRTLLTAFAGSIGIIGIALIFAVSNGVQVYIDRVQEDTLSSYPLVLEQKQADMAGMMAGMMADRHRDTAAHELDAVYGNTIMYEMVNAMNDLGIRQNDLGAFRDWLESGESGLEPYLSGVQYSYGAPFSVYCQDPDGKPVKADLYALMESVMTQVYGGDYSSYFASMQGMMGMELWQELLAGEQGEPVSPLVTQQYDLVYGDWPRDKTQLVLVLDENNEIPDICLYALGLKPRAKMAEDFDASMNGSLLEKPADRWTYADICSTRLRLFVPGECFQPNARGGYSDLTASETGLDLLWKSGAGLELHIAGIVRPKDGGAAIMAGALGFTGALTDYVLETTGSLPLILQQQAQPETDVLTGLPFRTGEDKALTDAEKAARVRPLLAALPEGEKAAVYVELMSIPDPAFLEQTVEEQMAQISRQTVLEMVRQGYARQTGMSPEALTAYIGQMDDPTLFRMVREMMAEEIAARYAGQVQQQLASMTAAQLAAALDHTEFEDRLYASLYTRLVPASWSDSTYDAVLKQLGWVDPGSPSTIRLFASSFRDKDEIKRILDSDYNGGKDREDQLHYTDFAGLLMSGVTSILNAITYVLIAFVAISLIVSSIMIGVITLISVQERTKEIGILRAIGASRRNVSSMFNAETVLIGGAAGALGVAVTWLLCIPINALIRHLTGIAGLRAALPLPVALVLILISMTLTLFSGLIPARSAAKKDPVVALRTE